MRGFQVGMLGRAGVLRVGRGMARGLDLKPLSLVSVRGSHLSDPPSLQTSVSASLNGGDLI